MAAKHRSALGRAAKAKRRPSAALKRGAAVSPRKNVRTKDPLARAKALVERGAFGEAITVAESLLDADPRYWPAREFIAHILWRRGYPKEAILFLESAIMTAPDKAEIQTRLASTLMLAAQQSGLMMERAVELAEKILARHVPTVPLLLDLSNLNFRCGRPDKALRTAERAVAEFPDSKSAKMNLSVALLMHGRKEDAVNAYATILKPYRIRTGANADNVRRQYANLAAEYDNNPLHQYFSARMAKFIADTIGPIGGLRMLDAGCGTGLLGTLLNPERLVGIDLSPEMIERARARNAYADLIAGDLVETMSKLDTRFDLIASSCVLYHLADLAPYFRQAARLLEPGGHLFISTDPAPDDMDIGESGPGEYAHSRAYLRRLAAKTGFAEIAIAIMGHRATPGFWCAFRKGSPANTDSAHGR
ncbi:MAG: methyltransferase domain-containing protein [Rhodospirillales bacterium]|nr:methyltransferase domain-containing protein [Rhodospirillales bacterium]